MIAMKWTYDPRQFKGEVKAELIKLNTDIAKLVYNTAVEISPVKTGMYRGNWHLSQGRARTGVKRGGTKTSPSRPPTEAYNFVARPYAKIHITNYTPYAQYIEYGNSTGTIMAHGIMAAAVQSAYNHYGAV